MTVGRLAVVVGGSKGLGLEAALELSKTCKVVAVARSQALLERLPVSYVVADVLVSPKLVAAEIKGRFGDPDIIYYAIGGSVGIKDWQASAEDYAKVWRYNLGVAIDLNREFLPAMVKKGWGRIVLTSTDGVRRNIGNAPYTSAKHALEGYVAIVGRELACKGVVMSAVAPGPIYTGGRWLYSQSEEWNRRFFDEHLPTGRFGTANEAAKVVAFLCSEDASFMAGAIVPVDGGSR